MDPADYQPIDPDLFQLPVEMLIGPRDAPGEEIFQITICSPQWLVKFIKDGDIVAARGYIIAAHYDFQKIRAFLELYVSRCEGQTWQDLAQQISCLGFWEFEQYH